MEGLGPDQPLRLHLSRRARRAAAPLAAALTWLAACAPVTGDAPAAAAPAPGRGAPGRAGLAAQAARLPAEAGGFRRGATLDHEAARPGLGLGTDYAAAQGGAVATVWLYDGPRRAVPAPPGAAAVAAEFDRALAEALADEAGPRLSERGREELAAAGGAPLRCAALGGDYARRAVTGLVCVGEASGRFLKLRVTKADAVRPQADARAFARAVAAAARGEGPPPPAPPVADAPRDVPPGA